MEVHLTSLIAVAIYLFYLLGIGLLIGHLFGCKRNLFLIGFGISVSILVLTQVPFVIIGGSLKYWYGLIHGLYIFLILTALIVNRGSKFQLRKQSGHGFVTPLRGAIGVAVLYFIYHVYMGAYTEIPSDFWSRLGDVTEHLGSISQGLLIGRVDRTGLFDDTIYIPFLHAVLAYNLNSLPLWLVSSVTLVTSVLFLLGIYWFTFGLIVKKRCQKSTKVLIALLATIFCLLTYGVASFSYVRYYAYFPHIINATLMFAVLALFLDYVELARPKKVTFVLISLFVLVMALINKQEALLVLVLLAAIPVWRVIRIIYERNWTDRDLIVRTYVLGLSAATIVIIGVSVVLFWRESSSWVQPHLISLGSNFPLIGNLPIANPKMRFWDTLGLFGIVVYVWYVFRRKWFRGMDYVNVAMFSPFYTLFNPVFVLFFLAVSSWDPLWRLSYLMPLPITAACLIGFLFQKSRNDSKQSMRYIDWLLMSLLFVSITQSQITSSFDTKSRLPSLVSSSDKNGAALWDDLVMYLDTLEEKQNFLTDPVTNYVLTTALKHEGMARAKERWQHKINLFSGNYQKELLYYGVDDKLLIINNRDGDLSINGQLSGHWPDEIVKVSKYYPKNLKTFVDERPADFRLIWESDQIWVYRVLRDPAHY